MNNYVKKVPMYFWMFIMVFLLKMPVQASDVQTFAPVFNSTYYAEKNADLASAYGNNEALLFQHFITCGMAEGRQGSEEFNVKAYRDNYTDLNAVFGDDLTSYYLHYIISGKAEGRIATPITPSPSTPTSTTSTPTENTVHSMFTEKQWEYANRVIELVNKERTTYGLGSVSPLHNLSSAAQARAKETVEQFSHTRPNNTSCFTIFDEYSVNYGYAGENIAAGQDTPEEVVDAWMNSPGHRANILNPNYNHLGVGCYTAKSRYGIHWCQLFTD